MAASEPAAGAAGAGLRALFMGKLGPFPRWAWGAGTVGVLLGVAALRHRSGGGKASGAAPVSLASGGVAAGSGAAATLPPQPVASSATNQTNDDWRRTSYQSLVSAGWDPQRADQVLSNYLDGQTPTRDAGALSDALRIAGLPPEPPRAVLLPPELPASNPTPPDVTVPAPPEPPPAPEPPPPAPAPTPAPAPAPAPSDPYANDPYVVTVREAFKQELGYSDAQVLTIGSGDYWVDLLRRGVIGVGDLHWNLANSEEAKLRFGKV